MPADRRYSRGSCCSAGRPVLLRQATSEAGKDASEAAYRHPRGRPKTQPGDALQPVEREPIFGTGRR